MLKPGFVLFAAILALSIVAAGCGHKLVAAPGEQTVAVYPDEDTYLKLQQLKKEGGMAGMLGGIGQNFTAVRVDDKTPVKILSSDDKGAIIQVLKGPHLGLKGFVPKNSLD
jgi:hypothetical protein